ncbi:MAG: ISL3 family transposase [Planctomycetes bacterium]|nr:ISL3 family transposase [Planctomycetota bacterium]
MPLDTSLLGLPGFRIVRWEGIETVRIWVCYEGPVECPHCQGQKLRLKDTRERVLRHASMGLRPCMLILKTHKYRCEGCQRYFNQRFPGIGAWRRSTEPYRRQIFVQHQEGISQKTLATRERLGSATVSRWYQDLLDRKLRERQNDPCPRILGIDEHFFSRKDGYATTFCDLGKRKIFDVTLGRSEKALHPYLNQLVGKDQVRVVCMDLSTTYRAIAREHFPKALIVTDRFHVIRLVNQRFLEVWGQLDPTGRSHRGLLSLMRRLPKNLKPQQEARLREYLKSHPAIEAVYAFWQKLGRLLRIKHRTARQCRRLIPIFLSYLQELRSSGFAPLRQLGETLESWKEEIVRMWRFTKNNGITEGFHTKMEMISRRAFGFRNFQNYRLRVRVLCGS